VDYWKMWPPILVFAYGFDTTVLHHVTEMKCIKGYRKMILDAELAAEVKL
jgi:hypothetical protein